jgi:large subunit ribosomal protein L28e
VKYKDYWMWAGGVKANRWRVSEIRGYKAVANKTAKSNYRGDLREAAVQRVSAIRRTQRPVKADPEPKLRGNKAKKAAAAAE